MKRMTCITCPIGCRVSVEMVNGVHKFFGNQCRRGAEFVKTELIAPLRSLTTTVRTSFHGIPVLPVRTNREVPKEKIPEIMRELSKITVMKKIGIGEKVAVNISGTGCDIIATSNMLHG